MTSRSIHLSATRAALMGVALGAAFAGLVVAQHEMDPPGEPKSKTTKALVAGAKLLQGSAPLQPMDVYLVGFHPMKDHPERQMEAHHYCNQVNEDFAQCALFDGNTDRARLVGIEYIVSEKLFDQLPSAERAFWHPHNAEILSGQLVAPDIPQVAELALMKRKMNSYGKTWHVWHTDTDRLPLGPPMLAWSFNRDGEARPGLVEQRDQRMDIDTTDKRRARVDLAASARPQSGVDDLKAAFPDARPMRGVSDSSTAGSTGASAPRR